MGDISDMRDLERFMRTPEGKSYLEFIRKKLNSRTMPLMGNTPHHGLPRVGGLSSPCGSEFGMSVTPH